MNAGPRNGSRRARTPFLLFPSSTSCPDCRVLRSFAAGEFCSVVATWKIPLDELDFNETGWIHDIHGSSPGFFKPAMGPESFPESIKASETIKAGPRNGTVRATTFFLNFPF